MSSPGLVPSKSLALKTQRWFKRSDRTKALLEKFVSDAEIVSFSTVWTAFGALYPAVSSKYMWNWRPLQYLGFGRWSRCSGTGRREPLMWVVARLMISWHIGTGITTTSPYKIQYVIFFGSQKQPICFEHNETQKTSIVKNEHTGEQASPSKRSVHYESLKETPLLRLYTVPPRCHDGPRGREYLCIDKIHHEHITKLRGNLVILQAD